jgi:transcriptional regulator with XRE-family HTH domain
MDTPNERAKRFGDLVRQLAPAAGYDLTTGAGGRAALARDVGMSPSAVGRMVNGETLPMPGQFEKIARALNTDVRNLMVAAGVISSTDWAESKIPDVRSATVQSPPSPEEAADAWGITDPMIRRMLISNIEQAIRLQREATEHTAASGGMP